MNYSESATKGQSKLDWRIRLLSSLLSFSKPLEQMSLEEMRQSAIKPIPSIIQTVMTGQQIPLSKIVQQDIPGRHGDIPVRLYYPSTESSLPLILFFHGGGWVYGNFQTHDRMCRRVAKSTGAIVLAVGYRLAPFHKYPIPLEDCYDTLVWAAEKAVSLKADPQQLTVMGDSAGGNLATAVCLMSRDQGNEQIAGQILLYPVTSGELNQASMKQNAHAPVLTKSRLKCFVNHYARNDADITQPYFSPLLAGDLSSLPPALIITSEYDPLRDQAKMYAQFLRDAEVSVELLDYPEMIHGFMNFPIFCREAIPAFNCIARYMKSASS